jgi:sporulation protein YlmC with PRC-barrel domain
VAVADTAPLTIGTKAHCADGECGRLTRVVLDPIQDRVTHLIVEPEGREGLGRLVPIEWADVRSGRVDLRCTRAEFDRLDSAEEVRFLPGAEGYPDYDPEHMLTWPYFGGNTTVPVTVDTLPVGEVAVQRGEEVQATDGRIGRVEGLVVDRGSQLVTHFVLQEGHLLGRKDVAIPIAAVRQVAADGIQLSMTKKEIEALPAVDFDRRAR